MTRVVKVLLRVVLIGLTLALLAVVGLFLALRSPHFQNYVRNRIVSYLENATGGQVGLNSLQLSLRTLTVVLQGLTIHGTEPPGDPPFFEAPSITLRLALFASGHVITLNYLGIDRPFLNIEVLAGRETNIPTPRTRRSSGLGSDVSRVVDLAIRRFDMNHGSLRFLDRTVPLNLQGQDLLANASFDSGAAQYQGTISAVLRVQYRSPVTAHLVVPFVVGRTDVSIRNARLDTSHSDLLTSARLYDFSSPQLTVEVQSHLQLAELRSTFGIPIQPAAGMDSVDFAALADVSRARVAIQHAAVRLGSSHIEAAGAGNSNTNIHGSLAVEQIARLFGLKDAPRGAVDFSAIAGLSFPSYFINGVVNAPRLTLPSAGAPPVDLSADFRVTPDLVALSRLELQVEQASLTGTVSIHDFNAVDGALSLHGLTMAQAAGLFAAKPVGYSGAISGKVMVSGLLDSPDVVTHLTIAPAHGGIPVSGHLDATYTAKDQLVTVARSNIQLPHSRLEVSGQPGHDASLTFTSSNLSDLDPIVARFSSAKPVVLAGGAAALIVNERGPLRDPALSGDVHLTNFLVDGRRFDSLAARFEASSRQVELDAGSFRRGLSQATFSALLGLRQWRPEQDLPMAAHLAVSQSDISDFLTLTGERKIPLQGTLTAQVDVSGVLASPRGAINANARSGSIAGQPFDQMVVAAQLSDGLVDLSTLRLTSPAGDLALHGTFRHPPATLASGVIQASFAATGVDLSRIQELQSLRPGFGGTVTADASLTAGLSYSGGSIKFTPSSVDGRLEASGIRDAASHYGNLTLSARTEGGAANVSLVSSLAGSNTQLHASIGLAGTHEVSADFTTTNLDTQKLVSLLSPHPLPIEGILSGNGHVQGTFQDPLGTLRFELANGRVYGQTVSHAAATVKYSGTLLSVQSLRASTSAGTVDLDASYSHPALVFDRGQVNLRISAPAVDLSKVAYLETAQPGIAGTAHVTGDAIADLRSFRTLAITRVNLNAGVQKLTLHGQLLGDASLTTQTAGPSASIRFNSTLASSNVRAQGTVDLRDSYPSNLNVEFSNLTPAALQPLGIPQAGDVNAVVDGSAQFRGPLLSPEQASGQLQLSKLQVTAAQGVTFRNQGLLTARLSQSILSIDNAHVIGPSTDVAISGTVELAGIRALDLSLRANADLAVLKTFSPGSVAGGIVDLDASVRGTLSSPALGGQIRITNGSLQLSDWPNGIYNAQGVILLSGGGGRIQSLTGESGGGKVSVSGFFSLAHSTLTYDLHADAHQVRTRYSGASVTATAAVTLSGTNRSGLLNGTVTISRVGYGQQSDIGSILSAATKPPAPPSAAVGPLSAIRAHVRIVTAPDVLFQTTLAQQLSATADLTLLGSLQTPGMVGRINITGGTLVFFSNKYSVNRGNISFYDALRIEPVLDIDLETIAQGVDVNLTVAGSIDDLKLTYRSDPPLRFEDIIALLAAGKTPPDPTIAANQPLAPDQSAMQMGESALLGAAVANPISSRLQRVFGVSQLTIAPTFVSGTALPQARVTLQQQVTQNVTFTYSQDVSQTNAELVRIDWELTPRFSAVATRDENGVFSVDFFWKKNFH